METVNLLKTSQIGFKSNKETKETPQITPEQKKNGAKLLALGAVAAATAMIAGLAIKGKIEKVNHATQGGISKLQDIKFSHG